MIKEFIFYYVFLKLLVNVLEFFLKQKKGTTINNAFQKSFNTSRRKPNKIWIDKDSKCYNRSL